MNLDPKTRKVTAGDITKLIPNATKDMVTLLLSQAHNAGSDPRGPFEYFSVKPNLLMDTVFIQNKQ
jgi:hypothetical protein